jgi:polyribonucleotide nucleotidyltransferase
MFNIVRKEFQFGQHQVVLETGRVARQANTVLITMGGVTVLLQLLLNLKQKQVKTSSR